MGLEHKLRRRVQPNLYIIQNETVILERPSPFTGDLYRNAVSDIGLINFLVDQYETLLYMINYEKTNISGKSY